MDGNGRWAAARALPRYAGHSAGIASVRRTVEEACRSGIEVLTLYAFSTENWKRPSVEIAALWELLARFLVCERGELLEQQIRLTAIGRRDRLPLAARTALHLTEQMTANLTGLHLRLAIDYGSQWALTEAARQLALQVHDGELDPETITPELFDRELVRAGTGREPVLVPPPDLLIRTGGEMRLSNFLLWECAYAELWFTDVLWPDFEVDVFQSALADYARRKRRFGDVEGRLEASTALDHRDTENTEAHRERMSCAEPTLGQAANSLMSG
jgi:undecaprenyl diphosphate synthase